MSDPLAFLKKALAYSLHSELSKLDKLYQRHRGQECYLFGDGVSLKWLDLREFSNRPSILSTLSIFHKDIRVLNIPYAVVVGPWMFWGIVHQGGLNFDRDITHRELRKSIREHPDTIFFINFSNYPVTRFSNAIYTCRWYAPSPETTNPFRERSDMHRGTLLFQLALAIYLGFKKAYLVGHDYTHLPSRNRHYYEKGQGFFAGVRRHGHEFISYAKQYIDLTTVTLDGTSETMNYITYQQLTGKEPRFKENTEIVDRAKLENLSAWHQYSIF